MTPPEPTQKPLVLVVDDDPQARVLAEESLGRAGFRVSLAANTGEAIEQFSAETPNAVLLDVVMPGDDGIAACRRLRELENGSDVPVVMLTSLDDVSSIEAAYNAGATDFVSKPIQWTSLKHRLHYMLRQFAISEALHRSQSRLADAQRIARIGDWGWDLMSNAMNWSDEVYPILGIQPEGFGATCESFLNRVHTEDRDHLKQSLSHARETGEPLHQDFRIFTSAGDFRFVHMEAEVLLRPDGVPYRMVGTVQDVTEMRQAQERIRYLDRHDPITGLPNRKRFKSHLTRLMRRKNTSNEKAAVLFVGLDRFKRINDTLGHDTGDTLLREAASRLQRQLSHIAPNEDHGMRATLAHFGGDEFTILLSRIPDSETAEHACRAVLDALSEPFHLGNQDIYITISAGVALYPDHATTPGELIKNADAALRSAKANGKNTCQFYNTDMNIDTSRQLLLESHLQKAVERNELALVYQPKVDTRTSTVMGIEALVRWYHPKLGMVSPFEFIPLAEETGLIVQIGEWVIRQACTQSKAWQDAGLPPVQVSVNLSPRQFWESSLAQRIGEILVETGVDPRHLEVEITEGTFMQNPEATVHTLTALKEMNIDISVDDFGTGYSSLAYLQKFPLDTLKVDRSFVKDVTTNPDSATITRTIITMAHSLGLKVIAEGVETIEQLDFITAEGCHLIQGYLFSPPIEADDVAKILKENRTFVKGKITA
ncbi:MAG: putative bifunctional diguanylate cyclase/phosphodiesterase [Leptospirillia bacterium]